MNKSYQIIREVVQDMGGEVEMFIPERGCYYIHLFGKRILLDRGVSITRESFISAQLTKCKDITYRLLSDAGLSTPHTVTFYNKTYNRTTAGEMLNDIEYPVIIKAARGSNSRGVVTNVDCAASVIRVVETMLPVYRSVVVQKMVFGKEYRLLVLGEQVIGALEMVHPYIIGDGTSLVRQLIEKKQASTIDPINIDRQLKKILKAQGVSLRKRVARDVRIQIKNNSCLAEGGETKDVTSIVHPDIQQVAVHASHVVGKYLVGIDVICDDIQEKPTSDNFHILEINGRPDLYIHYDPTYGQTRNVLKDILIHLVRIALPTYQSHNTQSPSASHRVDQQS